jgi:hypothetical protein
LFILFVLFAETFLYGHETMQQWKLSPYRLTAALIAGQVLMFQTPLGKSKEESE